MSTKFDDAIHLEAHGDLAGDTVTWSGFMTKDWSIGRVPNGGYSGALVLNALLQHSGQAVARSMTSHYYRPTIHGAPCSIITEVRRRGRTMVHADATLIQEDKVRVRTVGVFGDYPANDVELPVLPTEIPAPEDCVLRDPGLQGFHMSLMDSLEVRVDPSIETLVGSPDAEARIEGWARFRDPRPNDVLSLGLFADAFPPAVLIPRPDSGWIPTVELTSHIRAEAAPGWIRAQITTENIRGGTMIENARLWDETNTLVAESRQLSMLL